MDVLKIALTWSSRVTTSFMFFMFYLHNHRQLWPTCGTTEEEICLQQFTVKSVIKSAFFLHATCKTHHSPPANTTDHLQQSVSLQTQEKDDQLLRWVIIDINLLYCNTNIDQVSCAFSKQEHKTYLPCNYCSASTSLKSAF